jgi:hypothetical protein
MGIVSKSRSCRGIRSTPCAVLEISEKTPAVAVLYCGLELVMSRKRPGVRWLFIGPAFGRSEVSSPMRGAIRLRRPGDGRPPVRARCALLDLEVVKMGTGVGSWKEAASYAARTPKP